MQLPTIDAAVERAPEPATVARVGLGATILLAGVHKLLDPAAWNVYVLPWLAALLPTTTTTWTLANGVFEIPVGLGLLLDQFVAPLAAFVALSLAATVVYLAVGVVTVGRFGDVLVRDLGLVALATTVTLTALRD